MYISYVFLVLILVYLARKIAKPHIILAENSRENIVDIK
jgi:hypothetical protein